MASCHIKSVSPAGDRQVLVLDCANAVAGQEVRVLLATSPDGSSRRYFNDEQDTDGTQLPALLAMRRVGAPTPHPPALVVSTRVSTWRPPEAELSSI